jgi:polyhydroxyalkanoate synthase
MMPFDMRPDAVMQELSAYGQKLSHGMQNLMEVGEISTGVTPKTVVYQEDKLTLFRFEQPTRMPFPTRCRC